MSNNKIRVAIMQGDNEGASYEQIFSIFSEQEMFDICTPIIYGSPKVAAAKSKELQLECQFTVLKSVQDARDGKLNIIQRADEEAMADAAEGLVDVIVYGLMDSRKFKVEGQNILPLFINESVRMTYAQDITIENIVDEASLLLAILKRDYRLSDPRIAVLAVNAENGTEENDVLCPAIKELAEKGVKAFGPYQIGTLFDGREYEAFDAILAMNREQVTSQMKTLTNAVYTTVLSNQPVVCTMSVNNESLRYAIYTAIDIYRHQKEYDAPLTSPLPKLYHERPDNGEKLRFSIPKKKEEQ